MDKTLKKLKSIRGRKKQAWDKNNTMKIKHKKWKCELNIFLDI
jgi:hypothetical protein